MKQEFQYELIDDGDVININVTPHPDWEEFDQFIQVFIHNEEAVIINQDLGMDRHQVRYRKGEHQYILQFEHYTNSIWIENDF